MHIFAYTWSLVEPLVPVCYNTNYILCDGVYLPSLSRMLFFKSEIQYTHLGLFIDN